MLQVAKEQEELLKEYEAMKRKHEQLQNAVQLKSGELETVNVCTMCLLVLLQRNLYTVGFRFV